MHCCHVMVPVVAMEVVLQLAAVVYCQLVLLVVVLVLPVGAKEAVDVVLQQVAVVEAVHYAAVPVSPE